MFGTSSRVLQRQLCDQGQVVKAYVLYRCWVSEYQALSDLDANEHDVAIERLVLQTEGWERDEAIAEPQES